MQTEETLKRRIKTAEDLQSVVKTMKALAAVNIRQYEKAAQSLAEYDRTIEMGLRVALRETAGGGGVLRPEPVRGLAAVVFGSDQGMCGQLNDQIVSHAMETMRPHEPDPRSRAVVAVGIRARDRLEYAGQPIEETLPVPGSLSGVTTMVQEVVMIIEEWYFRRGIDRALLHFSEHLTGAAYRPHTIRLLPVDQQWLRRVQEKQWPNHALPTFTMEGHRLFAALIRQYLFVSLYRAFVESLASENASRLASMQGAEKNIGERLAELNDQYHRQRQMSITEELLDIVSGFEALKESE